MSEPPPRRPWWRRKRTWAIATALWLVAYPLSYGPASYVTARGGWGRFIDLPRVFYCPVHTLLPVGDAETAFGGHLVWWLELGWRHERQARERAAAES